MSPSVSLPLSSPVIKSKQANNVPFIPSPKLFCLSPNLDAENGKFCVHFSFQNNLEIVLKLQPHLATCQVQTFLLFLTHRIVRLQVQDSCYSFWIGSSLQMLKVENSTFVFSFPSISTCNPNSLSHAKAVNHRAILIFFKHQ